MNCRPWSIPVMIRLNNMQGIEKVMKVGKYRGVIEVKGERMGKNLIDTEKCVV